MLKDVETYLTEQVDSYSQAPSSDFDNVVTERVYWFKRIYHDQIRNAIEPTDVGLNNDGYLIDYNIKTAVAYSILTVKFTTRKPTGLTPGVRADVNAAVTYIDTTQNNIPLWQVVDSAGDNIYRTNWNYNLSLKKGSSGTPVWWEDADDLVIPDADKDTARWVSDPSQVLDGWYIAIQKTKQGIEEKSSNSVIIRYERYVRSSVKDITGFINKTVFVASDTYMTTNKIEVYGYTGEWLIMPSTVSPEGSLIKITTLCLHAKTWDEDLYGAPVDA